MATSGRGATPIFSPRPADVPWLKDSTRQDILKDWVKALDTPAWERTWGAFNDQREMIGHIDLRASSLSTGLHRATVGMGVDEGYRKNGLGRDLLMTAIKWAKAQAELDWLDLNVFANNPSAIRLYASCGFTEVGRMVDLFRVEGHSQDDLQMTLKLR